MSTASRSGSWKISGASVVAYRPPNMSQNVSAPGPVDIGESCHRRSRYELAVVHMNTPDTAAANTSEAESVGTGVQSENILGIKTRR